MVFLLVTMVSGVTELVGDVISHELSNDIASVAQLFHLSEKSQKFRTLDWKTQHGCWKLSTFRLRRQVQEFFHLMNQVG